MHLIWYNMNIQVIKRFPYTNVFSISVSISNTSTPTWSQFAIKSCTYRRVPSRHQYCAGITYTCRVAQHGCARRKEEEWGEGGYRYRSRHYLKISKCWPRLLWDRERERESENFCIMPLLRHKSKFHYARKVPPISETTHAVIY